MEDLCYGCTVDLETITKESPKERQIHNSQRDLQKRSPFILISFWTFGMKTERKIKREETKGP